MLSSKGHFLKKRRFSYGKTNFFSKTRLSKITLISASILVPTCLHVGLQNRRFSEIMAFQEAFKISSFWGIDFLSILGTSWPPTWNHLGGQDGLKFEKMGFKKFSGAPPCWFLIRHCFWTSFKKVLASILGGSGLDFWRFFDDFWSFLAYFGHVFGCACWGDYAPPDPPDLDWVFVFLGEVFSQLC